MQKQVFTFRVVEIDEVSEEYRGCKSKYLALKIGGISETKAKEIITLRIKHFFVSSYI